MTDVSTFITDLSDRSLLLLDDDAPLRTRLGRALEARGFDAQLVSSVAEALVAVKAGAVDYLSKPADADDVARALLATPGESPPPPDNPMSADRVRWEHIQRVYELCNHNVSETARRLNMHRRTLQRILAKRAPR